MGGLLAEKLCQQGILVTLVTPAAAVSTFTHNTLEQHRIQKSLLEMGVDVIASHTLASVSDGGKYDLLARIPIVSERLL